MNGGNSWPEQDAVERWWASHSMELKNAVTQYRILMTRYPDRNLPCPCCGRYDADEERGEAANEPVP